MTSITITSMTVRKVDKKRRETTIIIIYNML